MNITEKGELNPKHLAMMKLFTFHRKTFVSIKDILSDPELSSTAKILLQTILGLSVQKGYCYASNAYLAKLMNISESTLKTYLQELRSEELIKNEYLPGKTRQQRILVIMYHTLRKRYLRIQKIAS